MIELRVRQAYEEQRVLWIRYLAGEEAGKESQREIEVYAFDERYVDAFCRLRGQVRVFRLDRIQEALLLAERFSLDPQREYQVKTGGLSRMAHECQRLCCRPGRAAAPAKPSTPMHPSNGL